MIQSTCGSNIRTIFRFDLYFKLLQVALERKHDTEVSWCSAAIAARTLSCVSFKTWYFEIIVLDRLKNGVNVREYTSEAKPLNDTLNVYALSQYFLATYC